MAITKLFEPLSVGAVDLRHRIAMSAMTRLRNEPGTELPREINATYYEQRASTGGLIIAEGTSSSARGRGYIRAPHIWREKDIEAWKPVTDRVHGKGGFIFSQVMHAGRVSHSSLLGGKLPVAPSAVKMEGEVHVEGGKAPYETPHALTLEEIPTVVDEFVHAAKCAIKAGFDGIELHGGNGYLLQEFLAAKTNQRTDKYGGSVENRARLVLEIVDRCVEAIGNDRVAIKIHQGVTFSDLVEPEDDVLAQLEYLGPELEKRKVAYVCLSSLNGDPYYKFVGLEKPHLKTDIFKFFRKHYKGVLMINGGLSPQQVEDYLEEGTADLASFGVLSIANQNLPALIKAGKELNWGGGDMNTWYGKDPPDDDQGYTDWPYVDAPEV